MSDGDAADPADQRRAAAARARRIARVFGEPLPDTTSDERDPVAETSDEDSRLLREVPPHHN